MHPDGSSARSRRGIPLIVHLTALALVPAVGVLVLVSVLVQSGVAESRSAVSAEQSVQAMAQLETARTSVEQEIIPVLTLDVLAIPDTVERLGLSGFAGMLASQADAAVTITRRATDEALAQVPAGSPAFGAASRAIGELVALRAPAADGPVSIPDVIARYEGYLQLSEDLARAQRDAGADAGAEDVSAATRAAVADVAAIARASQSASREIPVFIGVMFVTGEVTSDAADWRTAHADYRSAAGALADLSGPDLARDWADLQALPAVRTVDGALDAQLEPGAAPVGAVDVFGLLSANTERAAAFSALLGTAVDDATALAAADRAAADSARNLTLRAGLALLLVSAGAVVLVGRSVARSLGRLASRAQAVSRGALVDVEVTGPREVRTVGAALRASVASLRRIKDQAGAVAAGDLDNALLAEPLPGPLGEVVHASVQQIVTSVRQREELQSALAHQAAHDPLTELPNRAQARRLLTAALHRGQRSGAPVGLLFIDLDGFKAVNDGFGHAAGDQVLRVVAARLLEEVRSGDVACRLGGDEFVVLVEAAESEQALIDLSTRLIEAVSAPIIVEGATMAVGASIGVAVSRDAGTDCDALLAQADAAVYRAKAHGRGRSELFDDALRVQLVARAEVQEAIGAGLAAGEMRLEYQPVHDVVSGDLTGYEALIRWDRPGHGTLQPDAFLPAARETRLICQLDRWALHEATRQLAGWRTVDGPCRPGEPTVAVNISGRHVSDPRVVADVVSALAASGLPAELLVLEVTETVLAVGTPAHAHLVELRARGVGVTIDDFGTGCTSIGQLPHLPVDTVKIHRSFVTSAEPALQTLVALMIESAHAFGLSVVAEGVEDAAQLTRVRASSCDRVQGDLLAPPMTPADAHARRVAGPLRATGTSPGPLALSGSSS